MNILYGRTDIKMAGPGIVMLKTAIALTERKHKIFVVSSGGALNDEFTKNGISSVIIDEFAITSRSPIDLIKAIFKVRKTINNNEIDVIHGHNLVSTLIMYFAALLSGRKVSVFTTIHGVGKESFFKFAPGKLIAVSKFVKQKLIFAGVTASKIEVIYNGFIDLEHTPFNQNITTQNTENNTDVNIIGVAMMTKFKGHRRLISAFSKVLTINPNAHLKLVGDGVDKEYLLNYVRELGISESVTFLGVRNDVPKLLSEADIFVHAPDSETFGMVVLEAMAAGLAVVTCNVGGIPELIDNGKSGFLVENDIDDIAHNINNLIQDSSLRVEFGRNARDKVKSTFDFTKIMDQYEFLYCTNNTTGTNE
jgi:glycosyltransferase involved in cell wall biosynthesis